MTKRSSVTLQEFADLAGVQRHVVTMWRRRSRVRGRIIPFPVPVTRVGGVERFLLEDVVVYLETTGRGNNVEARQDAPALAVPDGADIEDAVALLCLRTLGGVDLEDLDLAELTDLALQVDPHDRLLVREVRALTETAGLARYVDDLTAASYGPPDALARLDSGPLRRQADRHGLTAPAVALLGAVTAACRMHLPGTTVVLAPSSDDQQLIAPLADGFAGLDLPATARAARRRAVIDGIELVDDPDACVRVVSLVGCPELEVLEAADDLVLSLAPSDAGVVLGPATALCDPLYGKAAENRAETLRPGNLAMALRLPRGLRNAAHRQSLAVWVLTGVADPRRSVCLADLESVPVDLGDLGSDVMAALQGTQRRAYRYARRVEQATMLAGVEVVPRGVRATQVVRTDPVTHLDRIHAATLVTAVALPGHDVVVAPAPGQVVLRQRSLDELRKAGQLRMLRGNRIDGQLADPAGTVAVLTADGPVENLRLDPFDVVRVHPRATRTEPGDLVFVDGRHPTARVDPAGGALVATPSRVLRLGSGGPVGPWTLAAIINDVVPPGSKWPVWVVPDLPPDERDRLEAALAAAADRRARLHDQLHALHDLAIGLVAGVASGAVTLDPTLTDAKAG